MLGMGRTWLSIRVELVQGRAQTFWRPGRIDLPPLLPYWGPQE
jgi:hypothetical protein